MGLMDAFTADAKVEFKVGELYDILRVAASNEKTALFLKNAIECEVPYEYIREIMTGKKEEKEKTDGIRVEIPRDILDVAFEEAKKAAREVAAGLDLTEKGINVEINTQIDDTVKNDEVLKNWDPKKVSCGYCKNREICELDLEGEDKGKFPKCFYPDITQLTEESEGKEE